MAISQLAALAKLTSTTALAFAIVCVLPAVGKEPLGPEASADHGRNVSLYNNQIETNSNVEDKEWSTSHQLIVVAQAQTESSIITLGPAEVDVYWFTATLLDGKLIFDGYVPDQATLNRIRADDRELGGLQLADGEPQRFGSAVDFGLDLLARMAEGRFSIRDNVITIKGRAMTAGDLAGLNETLGQGAPQGLILALSEIRLPLADPFTFRAEKVPDGKITLTGHVPDDDARASLMGTADTVVDQTELADGAPEGFIPAAQGALTALLELPAGTIAFDGTSWHFDGAAADPMQAFSAGQAFRSAGLDPAQWTYRVRLPTAVPPEDVPSIADYEWTAEKLPAGTIALSGHVPTANLKQFLAVRAGEQTVDSSTVGTGAPDDFALSALAALDALLLLEEGEASFAAGRWTLVGRTSDASLDVVTATLGERAAGFDVDIAVPQPEPTETVTPAEPQQPEPPGERTAAETAIETVLASPAEKEPLDRSGAAFSEIEADRATPAAQPAPQDVAAAPTAVPVTERVVAEPAPTEPAPPPEPVDPEPAVVAALPPPTPAVPGDFIFEGQRSAAGAVSLGGVVPADATRRYFAVIAGNVPVDELALSDTLPADFIPSANAGVRALTELFDGELGFDGARWYLTGTADTEEQRTAALGGITALPNAAAWTTDIALTPPAKLCGRTVAAFATSNAILFQSGSARMTEDSAASLAGLATSLAACPGTEIWVEGHTDADGPEDLNLALSVSRAEAVVEALTTLGVDAGRLYAVGYGESLPIASNDTSDGKRANRRIVFTVVEQ